MLYQLSYNGLLREWWTGKDSNLRTSQGGADLQSAGFNHSPTCAISGEHRATSVEQSLLSLVAHRSQLKAFSDTPLQSIRITHCHGDQKVRVEKIRANNSSGKFPYGVLMEKLSAARPANPAVRNFSEPILEFKLPNSGNSSLELAKGFEPLTL